MFTLKITVPDDQRDSFLHRFHNFGEEVYHELHDLCSISIDEIDHATNHFMIRKIKRKDLGRITQTVQHLLEKHYFIARATIKKV
ncbi:MAG: hypothetical protein FJ147_04220 [Deltaproteobacteria bacterium]|nr:hypothetical protein [Deltaproteobacteria bacterium]